MSRPAGFDSTERVPGDLYCWYRTYWDNANTFTLISQEAESGTRLYLTKDGVKPEDLPYGTDKRHTLFRFQ
jgi:hypothetical protein